MIVRYFTLTMMIISASVAYAMQPSDAYLTPPSATTTNDTRLQEQRHWDAKIVTQKQRRNIPANHPARRKLNFELEEEAAPEDNVNQ